MTSTSLVRDSFVVFAMVVLSVYAAAVVLEAVLGRAEAGTATILAGGLVLVIVGLGFLLRRIVEFEAES